MKAETTRYKNMDKNIEKFLADTAEAAQTLLKIYGELPPLPGGGANGAAITPECGTMPGDARTAPKTEPKRETPEERRKRLDGMTVEELQKELREDRLAIATKMMRAANAAKPGTPEYEEIQKRLF